MSKVIQERKLTESVENMKPSQVHPQHPIGGQIHLAIKNDAPEAAQLCLLWAAKLLGESSNPDDQYARVAMEFYNVVAVRLEYNEAIAVLENRARYSNDLSVNELIVLGKECNKTNKANLTIDSLANYYDDEENSYNEDIANILAEAYIKEEEYALAGDVLENIIKHAPDNNWTKVQLKEVDKLSAKQQQSSFDPPTYSL